VYFVISIGNWVRECGSISLVTLVLMSLMHVALPSSERIWNKALKLTHSKKLPKHNTCGLTGGAPQGQPPQPLHFWKAPVALKLLYENLWFSVFEITAHGQMAFQEAQIPTLSSVWVWHLETLRYMITTKMRDAQPGTDLRRCEKFQPNRQFRRRLCPKHTYSITANLIIPIYARHVSAVCVYFGADVVSVG